LTLSAFKRKERGPVVEISKESRRKGTFHRKKTARDGKRVEKSKLIVIAGGRKKSIVTEKRKEGRPKEKARGKKKYRLIWQGF